MASVAWRQLNQRRLAAFASGNGRLEAMDVDVAAHAAGRLLQVDVREGDRVRAGQILARMDAAALTADLHQAQAARAQAIAGHLQGAEPAQPAAERGTGVRGH